MLFETGTTIINILYRGSINNYEPGGMVSLRVAGSLLSTHSFIATTVKRRGVFIISLGTSINVDVLLVVS